ncbi:MAG: Uma2 family endonuclease [Deltaproteobacteria bacterium]
MPSTALKLEPKFTYADYRSWPDDERWEIIDSVPFAMTPAPGIRHQRISGNFFGELRNFFRGRGCVPFGAPTDVVLDDDTVVQPDVFVVCDRDKITEDTIQGAPDLVVEILSPATRIRDKREKKALYERFGVREYLIVSPDEELVERYRLVERRYWSPDIFNWDETLTSSAFPELTLNLWEIFDKEAPAVKETAPEEQS